MYFYVCIFILIYFIIKVYLYVYFYVFLFFSVIVLFFGLISVYSDSKSSHKGEAIFGEVHKEVCWIVTEF